MQTIKNGKICEKYFYSHRFEMRVSQTDFFSMWLIKFACLIIYSSSQKYSYKHILNHNFFRLESFAFKFSGNLEIWTKFWQKIGSFDCNYTKLERRYLCGFPTRKSIRTQETIKNRMISLCKSFSNFLIFMLTSAARNF
jgi:hypothetical protein